MIVITWRMLKYIKSVTLFLYNGIMTTFTYEDPTLDTLYSHY